jgi:hypothetical protein
MTTVAKLLELSILIAFDCPEDGLTPADLIQVAAEASALVATKPALAA